MRKSILFLFLIFGLTVLAQTISVSSFKLLDNDLTANTAGTIELDQNGETAALIKVVTTQTGFTFDGGSMGIVKTKQTPGEVWVYIPRGTKKISIKHPQLGVLRDYYFPVAIDAAKTYEMVLVSGEVKTVIKESVQSQFLVLKVTPIDAIVELDNEIIYNNGGIAQKFVKLGTYDYRVQAPNYHTSAGKVTVDNIMEKKILSVDLKPAFGKINIGNSPDLDGALVYIDNALIGKAPILANSIPSGKHNLKISKPLYKIYEETISINDNEVHDFKPILIPNYSLITIKVDDNADIYVNQEKKGSGSWTGKLESGTYILEARKEGYHPTIIQKDINAQKDKQEIKLEKPIPIFGELKILSNPTMANVYIDGILAGTTPLYLPQVIIGDHKISILKDDNFEYTSNIVVSENQLTDLDVELKIKEEKMEIEVICNVPTAEFYVDKNLYGNAKGKKYVSKGYHEIKAIKKGYEVYSTPLVISHTNKTITINMVKNRKG